MKRRRIGELPTWKEMMALAALVFFGASASGESPLRALIAAAFFYSLFLPASILQLILRQGDRPPRACTVADFAIDGLLVAIVLAVIAIGFYYW
jgi:hypothetical protein